jgi:DNA-binding response OmpR family regulator/predicted regulator of Ras-like GTPase activity (Roadblock/LC7/MglB family)
MSKVWRICVVEGDASLNQKLVNSLRKDGYVVQGVMKTADAMRVLWSEECDVVICDLNLPGADGFTLLHWLRAYRSNVRPIVLGDASRTGDSDQRLQAMESGAISYIEKPVDLRLLKDELRRLLQQTGFTANLDSFDLLDVIQIITMSRKSITLLINTGLEEHGMLRFQDGDLAWAEYGALHGEEAFFALAAHKNGTVTQQLSDGGPVTTNVTQPLSRLIFQALQYRSKYADKQQPLGQGSVETGLAPVPQSNTPGSGSPSVPFLSGDIDDSPFLFTSEGMVPNDPGPSQQMPQVGQVAPAFSTPQEPLPPIAQMDLHARREAMNTSPSSPLQGEMNRLEKDSAQMPSWLTEQPTSAQIPVRSPTHFSSSKQTPIPPLSPSLSSEMRQIQAIQSAQVPPRTTDPLPNSQQSASYMQTFAPETEVRRPSSPQWSQEPQRPSSSPQWSQEPQRPSSSPQWSQESQRPSSSPQHRLAGQSGGFERTQGRQNPPDALRENNPTQPFALQQPQRQVTRKNYAALVSALQTLGYSLPGFIAAAVVGVDSHLIAQVAMDDTDKSQIWQLLSVVQRNVLNALQPDEWGMYEETVMTTGSRHILMRTIANDKNAFLVLITTRETNFIENQEIMANVEAAITAALR